MSKVFHVILAGGWGTRLWPLSTSARPKQFVCIEEGNIPLIESTIQRVQRSGEPKNQIIISTNGKYFDQVKEVADRYGIDHIIKEPAKRNTAAAQALAIHYAISHCGAQDEDVIVFSNSDHVISPVDDFIKTLYKGVEAARSNDGLVIYGIKPSRPDTGYGYIEVADPSQDVCHVLNFREKPNLHTATEYLQKGNYFWNSGIYVGRIGIYTWSFQKHCPKVGQIFSWSYDEVIERFSELPDLQVDVAIAERSNSIACVPMSVSWSDVGSWDRICEVRAEDDKRNLTHGKNYLRASSNNLVWWEDQKKIIVINEVHDLVIVDTKDALYISKKWSEGSIKQLLSELKESDFSDFL